MQYLQLREVYLSPSRELKWRVREKNELTRELKSLTSELITPEFSGGITSEGLREIEINQLLKNSTVEIQDLVDEFSKEDSKLSERIICLDQDDRKGS